jgi:hypothetical protein
LPGVLSKPDGLYAQPGARELAIVEAKKRSGGFAEGTSQLLQYFGQAHWHPRFRGWTVIPYLVTAEKGDSPDYAVWQELMRAPTVPKFFIRD